MIWRQINLTHLYLLKRSYFTCLKNIQYYYLKHMHYFNIHNHTVIIHWAYNDVQLNSLHRLWKFWNKGSRICLSPGL